MSEPLAADADQPGRKQQQRSIVTQQKLLDAAVEAFSENGFKGTSTRDIAERAGVHHPLITYHFKNKDQLWRAATDQVFTEFGSLLTRSLKESAERDPKKRFKTMIRTFVRHARNQPAVHRIIVQESSTSNPRMDWLVKTHLKPFFEGTIEQIEELQRLGIAVKGNSALLYHMVRLSAGGMLALEYMLLGTSDIDLRNDDTLDELVDMIVRVFFPGEMGSNA